MSRNSISSVSVSSAALDISKPIDYDHLKRYVGDDIQLMKEVLGIFRGQASLWLSGFNPHASDQDWTDIAHAMKGGAYGIGAWQIGDICLRAEELDIEKYAGDLDELVAQRSVIVEELLTSFAVLLNEIDSYLSDIILS